MFPAPIERQGRGAQISYRVAIWVVLFLWLLPLLAVMVTSIRSLTDITQGNYWGWPTDFNMIENYAEVFTRTPMGKYLINSILITLPTAVGAVALATMAGFALAYYRFRFDVAVIPVLAVVLLSVPLQGASGFVIVLVAVAVACGLWWLLSRVKVSATIVLFAMFIAGNFIPFQILMIPVRNLTIATGLYDTVFALIIFHIAFQTGFCTLFMRNFIKGLPYELIEAARMEGANEFELFWYVVMPLMRPALAALSVLIFTFIWNDYFWALVLVQSDNAQPITAGIQALRGQWIGSWNLISAGSIVAALPPVAMFFIMQRHFIAGLTLGGVKG